MSDQEQLPVCVLCGEAPNFSRLWKTARCESAGCRMRSVEMGEAYWRRLMDRPRLAPEHVEELRGLMRCGFVSTEETAAIRAAIAALTRERDEARQKLKTMMMAAVALIETAKEVCGE